jgi:hypothetical protein
MRDNQQKIRIDEKVEGREKMRKTRKKKRKKQKKREKEENSGERRRQNS